MRAGLRQALVLWHRWFGLIAAGFLCLSGLTGAVIAWDHELDGWLNPHWHRAATPGSPRPSLALADAFEASHPGLKVAWLPLAVEADQTLDLRVVQANGMERPTGADQFFIDPVTGATQGARRWGEPGLARGQLMPFLYKLHYSLHLPDVKGIGVGAGVLFLGLLAMAWAIDCVIALWLAFPSLRAWRKSFAFRWREGGYRLNFDLHRSGSVWLWGLLLTLAVSSVAMNLPQVLRPIVGAFSTLTPSPFEHLPPPGSHAQVSRATAVQIAEQEARRRGWPQPAGGLYHGVTFGVYGVGFYAAGMEHGDIGLGNPWVYIDDRSGAVIGVSAPGEGSAGDVFLQAQFPLHSGRIAGLAGRILVSALGLAVAVVCVTGVVIWAKKRRARRKAAPQRQGEAQAA